MRPFFIHLCILAFLMVIGIALFVTEAFFFEANGMLFSQYVATRLYWLAFGVYAIVSTTIVTSVYIFHKITKKVFTKKAVILSHVLPIGFVWVLIEFNVHDIIQNTWESRADKRSFIRKQPVEDAVRQKPQVPRSPLRKRSLYQAPNDNLIEPQKQTADRDHAEGVQE